MYSSTNWKRFRYALPVIWFSFFLSPSSRNESAPLPASAAGKNGREKSSLVSRGKTSSSFQLTFSEFRMQLA